MAGSEKDAGFCSGGDEDDMSGLHSPSASEDSVEVQVTPISLRNKRKLAEPRKIQELSTAPLKKRRFEQIEEPVVVDEESRPIGSPSPFRPWSSGKATEPKIASSSSACGQGRLDSVSSQSGDLSSLTSRESQEEHPARKLREGDEKTEEERRRKRDEERLRGGGGEGLPLKLEESNRRIEARLQGGCLPQRRESRQKPDPATDLTTTALRAATPMSTASSSIPLLPLTHPRLQEEPLSLVLRGEIPRVPSHPAVSGAYDRSSAYPMDGHGSAVSHHHSQNHQQPGPAPSLQQQQQPQLAGQQEQQQPLAPHHQHQHQHQHQGQHQSQPHGGGHSRQQREGGQQRNYKNMTRERRIEANARERTRVHTISAAFDTLRRAIPAYSHNQKLSKLSVLRIACSYIMTLGKIVNTPEGEPANGASLGACVDLVSRTIQTEGKLRKRKED